MCTYKIKFMFVKKKRYQEWRRDDFIDWHTDNVPSDERYISMMTIQTTLVEERECIVFYDTRLSSAVFSRRDLELNLS